MFGQIKDFAIPNLSADTIEEIMEMRRQKTLLKAMALQNVIFNSAKFSSITTDTKGVIQTCWATQPPL